MYCYEVLILISSFALFNVCRIFSDIFFHIPDISYLCFLSPSPLSLSLSWNNHTTFRFVNTLCCVLIFV